MSNADADRDAVPRHPAMHPGEIGARPPGVGCWDLYSASNDVDVYREWAHVITHRAPESSMRRPYAAGRTQRSGIRGRAVAAPSGR